MSPYTSLLSFNIPQEGVEQCCNDAPSRVAVRVQGGSHVRRMKAAEAGLPLASFVATAVAGRLCRYCWPADCSCF